MNQNELNNNTEPNLNNNIQTPIEQNSYQYQVTPNESTINTPNNNNKNTKNKLALIISIIVIFVATSLLLIPSLTNHKDKLEENNDNNPNNSISNEQKCEANDTKVTGLKRNKLNDYYNIDTSKFDKSKFNGEINFYGATVNGKITTNKLKNLGITIEDTIVYSKKWQREHYQETGIWHFGTAKFSIDTTANITNPDSPIAIDPNSELSIIDYTGGTELYSDSTVIVANEGNLVNLTGRNIFPKQLGINNYNEITIDLVLEKLGNPTYVDGRKSLCLETENSYTTYIYVYDEVAFVFSFYNWRNLSLAGMTYHPIERLNGSPKTTYNYNGKEYNSIIEAKKEEQRDYLNSSK